MKAHYFMLLLLTLTSTLYAQQIPFKVERVGNGPMIHPDNDPPSPKKGYDNLMGAHMIRAPKWLKDAPGKYLMYFGRHHHDGNIYLAYSDKIEGPYRLAKEPALKIENTVYKGGNHIASPDVIVDHANKRLIMLFHGNSKKAGHNQSVATSKGVLNFQGEDRVLSGSSSIGYLRAIKYRDRWLGIGKSGKFFQTDDLVKGKYSSAGAVPAEPGIKRWRHGSLLQHKNQLYVFYTCLGDTPEHIKVRRISVDKKYKVSAEAHFSLLKPEKEYEGANLPITTGQNGEAKKPENALRDPSIFIDEDGSIYMLYAVKGEFGIAIAKLIPQD